MKVEANGLTFDASSAGNSSDELVLLLHGFPQTSHTWRDVLPALGTAGYFGVAPNQRGYSPLARPAGIEAYATTHLMSDALAIADRLGKRRFHLVGHDWGGQLAWLIAGQHPERIASLTILSRPHPRAFLAAMKGDSQQSHRSRHHRAFQDETAARRLLENDGQRLRETLVQQGVPEDAAQAYLDVLGGEDALDAALAWYRASAITRVDARPIEVPTLYIWGDADATVGRVAAEGTREHVTGTYRFEVLPGVGHFVTDQAAGRVSTLLLAHLESSA